MRLRSILSSTLALALPTLGVPASAQFQTHQLLASDGAITDRFGYSVAIEGNVAIVGATDDDHSGFINVGSAYVFEWNGSAWVETAKLTPSILANDAFYGHSVDLSDDGTVAIVGAATNFNFLIECMATPVATVYVYRSDPVLGWVEEAVLQAPPGPHIATTAFGDAVSLRGDGTVLAVGAPLADFICTPPPTLGCAIDCNSGAVYMYEYNGTSWNLTDTITAFDGATDDRFGDAVSVSGDALLVGAFFDDNCPIPVLPDCGSAYVYRFNGTNWLFEQKLVQPDAFAVEQFGRSVSLQGNMAVVGANSHDNNQGAAYVYRFTGGSWVFQQDFMPADAMTGDQFTFGLGAARNIIVGGSPFKSNTFTSDGAAYVYRWNGSTWTETLKVTEPTPGDTRFFGFSADVSGRRGIVGAPGNGVAPVLGAAYIYQ